ncbi:hypothetical protein LTR36_002499 [Oleoguttula mirabilis]|uniref:FAD/NAD(P)-binding domain-containing protein n=1 Tax=Oleoguttula mirabilis TaxID=1507867 RepID=A0AAV9JKZ7_9PEZI|nr:hypothetical protein LTR36_002499 [Oleoguttula mirabilis]
MALKNVVVIGGSYVGTNVAEQLAAAAQGRFRVLLIEKNSHFQHLFAFPRFAVTTAVNTHKAFIPYTAGKFGQDGAVLQAAVTGISKSAVQLDRKVLLDGQHQDSIPYSYLAITTGTKLTPPSSLPGSEKLDGVTYLHQHADKIKSSQRIVIIGAGAVGVQMATDVKEIYPEKSVTLIHSRKNVMSRFHPGLHEIIAERCKELGVELVLGSRVKLPSTGYPTDRSVDVELMGGRKIPADFAIVCNGQVPQSTILQNLAPQCIDNDSFIRTLKTLQINDPEYSNIFALGDVADTGAHKAARPAGKQAEIVAKNIVHLIEQEPLEEYEVQGTPAIHMSLGVKKNVVFANPPVGSFDEPMIKHRDDGTLDMNIDGVWSRRGGGPNSVL